MLDIQLLRNDLQGVAQRLASRGTTLDTAAFERLEANRKAVQTQTQELQAKRNQLSKQVGQAKAKGEDAAALMAEVGSLCRSGKRDAAQAKALAFGRQFETSAEMQQLLACAKRMNSVLPMLLPSAAQLAENGQVCDLPLE